MVWGGGVVNGVGRRVVMVCGGGVVNGMGRRVAMVWERLMDGMGRRVDRPQKRQATARSVECCARVQTYGATRICAMSFPSCSAISLLATLATHCMARVMKSGCEDSKSFLMACTIN